MTEDSKQVNVVHNDAEQRWEADVDGSLALLTYDERDNTLYLLHTEVPTAAEGQGIGGQLVKAALEHARGAGMKVAPFCAFASAYMDRHSEYEDLRADAE
jgi:uncharacterized protein